MRTVMNLKDESFPAGLYSDISTTDSFHFNSFPSTSKSENSSEDNSQRSAPIGIQTATALKLSLNDDDDDDVDNKKDYQTEHNDMDAATFYQKNTFQKGRLQRKSLSCEGLNRESKGKYDHVTSKVKVYIDKMKAESNKQKKFTRHRSMPMLEMPNVGSIPNDDQTKWETVVALKTELKQKDDMIADLKRNFETVTENFSECNMEKLQLKRKLENLRTELTDAKRLPKGSAAPFAGPLHYQSSARFNDNFTNIDIDTNAMAIMDVPPPSTSDNHLRKRTLVHSASKDYQILENTRTEDELQLDDDLFRWSSSPSQGNLGRPPKSKASKKSRKLFKMLYCCGGKNQRPNSPSSE